MLTPHHLKSFSVPLSIRPLTPADTLSRVSTIHPHHYDVDSKGEKKACVRKKRACVRKKRACVSKKKRACVSKKKRACVRKKKKKSVCEKKKKKERV